MSVLDARTRATLGHLSDLVELAHAMADGPTTTRDLLERVVGALSARAGVLRTDDQVVTTGADSGPDVMTALLELTEGVVRPAELDRPEAGGPPGYDIAMAEQDGVRLAVAVRAPRTFTAEQRALLEAMSRLVALGIRIRALVTTERGLRRRGEDQVRQHGALLISLREQRSLLQRLSRIQRSISARQPLQDVLDAIVRGASELLGEDIAGLRLLDPTDPDVLVLVSSRGVPAHLLGNARRQPLHRGVGARVVVEDRLVLVHDYSDDSTTLPGYAEDGIRSAMGAPVRQAGAAVGSLVVATRRPDRVYSESEQEALLALAEHVSLALNDAQAVAELRTAVERSTHASMHDGLTGLPNRMLFLERLSDAADSARSAGTPVSVLFLDLDDFKLVNDSLGHLLGDELVRRAAARIVACTRGVDTVARLGGDEFAVLLDDTGQGSATHTAERILAALAEPVELSGHTVHVGASIGLVSSTSGQLSAEDLLRDADVAMYRAKAAGKHRFVVFESSMRDRLQQRGRLEAELRQAVELGQVVVHYQPVVNAVTGQVESTEALVRWEHPQRGLLEPEHFVALTEDTGLIGAIGADVLEQACTQTAAWRRLPGMAELGVSVNLSPRQLQEPRLLATVQGALSASGLPPAALVLEITESMLVRDTGVAVQRLDQLKSLGVRLAVDDFGTGYSSLSYLGRLPVDILKVDRSFVSGMAGGLGAGRLAAAVLAMAASLGLETVAEGVELTEQADALRRQGCTRLQGFLFSGPVTAELLPATVLELMSRGSLT